VRIHELRPKVSEAIEFLLVIWALFNVLFALCFAFPGRRR
jgi:hypothetical protein